jgi:isoleucyl-tRNA synthetase
VQYEPAHGEKCVRCWRILPEVTAPKFLCVRCDEAVAAWDTAKAAAE